MRGEQFAYPPSEIRKLMQGSDVANLPLYSQSGFDMLSILGRVASRPNPTIKLGPVDMSCSFVVCDVRLVDNPIVYASRTFLDLTGYTEEDVLGKNCRFLQSPGGDIRKGDQRKCTSSEAVSDMKFNLAADRECQVSLINYRKDGKPFVNRVSIVPVPSTPGSEEIAYHVGFQIDLNEQPSHIVQRLRDGSYYTNDADFGLSSTSLTIGERCGKAMSKDLRGALFQNSLIVTTSSNAVSEKPDMRDAQQWLDLSVLEHSGDFFHVLSLKGHFLYVSPSVRSVLGYEAHELLNASITDFCHQSDVVPLQRELKATSAQQSTVVNSVSAQPEMKESFADSDFHPATTFQPQQQQKTINLLFRIRNKAGTYVWLESLGRLHVEAGKNRKAVILSGRLVGQMPSLMWKEIAAAGGITTSSTPTSTPISAGTSQRLLFGSKQPEHEFWTLLSKRGILLSASSGVRELLGWGPGEIIGRSLKDFVVDSGPGQLKVIYDAISDASRVQMSPQTSLRDDGKCHRILPCGLQRKDGTILHSNTTIYSSAHRTQSSLVESQTNSTACVIAHFRLASSSSSTATAQGRILRDLESNVFEELGADPKTSWQFEIQQQKFANWKLLEEMKALESELQRRC